MRKLKGILVLILLLALLASPIVVLASDISGAKYYGTIIVSNNSTAATNVAVNCTISTQALIDGGYLNSSANNCVVRSSAGADLPFMPSVNATYPWCVWVPSIGQDSHLSNILYTANSTGGEIRYFPAAGGMATTDSTSLELGDNFTIEQSGWWDTDYGADKTTVYKEGAFKTFISEEEEVSSLFGLDDDDYLDFVNANGDWVRVPDHNDFSFAGDTAFTLIMWVNCDAGATSRTFLSKFTEAGNLREWRFNRALDHTLQFLLCHNDDIGKRIARNGSDISAYDGAWIHLATTYDGSESSDGLKIYLNGADISTTTADAGVYTGMTNTASDLEIGSYNAGASSNMDGGEAEVKIYARELTPAQLIADSRGFVSTTNLNGWWRIDDGAGNPADSSGKGHNANANTADWVTGFDEWRTILSVTASGVESSEHIVRTSANLTHLAIFVDDMVTPKDSAVLTANVTDSANDWVFLQNNAMPYMESHTISVNGTQVQYIDWEYDDTTFSDSSGFDNDATPTFRTTSSDADVSAVLSSFLPVAEAKAPAYALEDAPAFIETTPTIVSQWVVTPVAGTFPLATVITAVANATSTPAQLPLLIIAAFIILAFSLSISALMRRYGSGSLIVKIIVITAVMGVFIAVKNFGIEFWMLFVFLVIAIALAMGSKQVGWQ